MMGELIEHESPCPWKCCARCSPPPLVSKKGIATSSVFELRKTVVFFVERIRRRVRENEHTLAVHPDEEARKRTAARLEAYLSVLYDAEKILVEGE